MKSGVLLGVPAVFLSVLFPLSSPASAQECRPEKIYDVFVQTARELEQKLNFYQPDLPYDVHGFYRRGQGFQAWITARCARRNRHAFKLKYEEYNKDAMSLRMRVGVAVPLSLHRGRDSTAICIWYALDETRSEEPEPPLAALDRAGVAGAEEAAVRRCTNP